MQTHPTHYPTDLTDEEWNQIESLVPAPKSGKGKRGRLIELDRRSLVNAIFYVVRSGCAWRLLWAGLKTAEGYGLRLNFRSDNLVSLMYQNRNPDFSLNAAAGLICRPFEVEKLRL